MIDKNDFYREDENLSKQKKTRMWNNIKYSLVDDKRNSFHFEIKNFSLGFGFAVMMFFFFIGVYTSVSNFFISDKPEIVKLNEAYLGAIKSVEKASLINANISAKQLSADEIYIDKTRQLQQIDIAIDEFIAQSPKNDYSKLKQLKLNELYQIKLEIISKIIKLKEQQL